MNSRTNSASAGPLASNALKLLSAIIVCAGIFAAGCTFLYYRDTVVLKLPGAEQHPQPGAYESALAGKDCDINDLLVELQEKDVGSGAGQSYRSLLKDKVVTLFVVTGGKAPYEVVLRRMVETLSGGRVGAPSAEGYPLDLTRVLDGRNRECLAFTLVYLMLGRNSGLKIFPVVTRGHIMVLYDDGVNHVYIDAVRGLFERSKAKLSERFFGTATPPEPYLRPLTDMELASVILANRAVLLSDGEEALKNAKAAVALFPKLPLAWVNLGFTNLKSGRMEEAKRAYERALEIDSANPYAINGLARLLLDESAGGTPNPVEAMKLLERALQAHGEVPAFIRSTYKDAQRLCGDIPDRSQK